MYEGSLHIDNALAESYLKLSVPSNKGRMLRRLGGGYKITNEAASQKNTGESDRELWVSQLLTSMSYYGLHDEFGLSDFQFGILTFFGFMLFYTTLDIPIACLSGCYIRIRIIGSCAIL